MSDSKLEADKEKLDYQQVHWEDSFCKNPAMFGEEPSEPARKAVELFQKEGKTSILELGPGQGRDTLFFAKNGFQVTAVDYTKRGLDAITEKASRLKLSKAITAKLHDLREPLPFEAASFDACFSHMLFCMALTTRELETLSREIRRVLRPGGINIYTVRHTGDIQYGAGIHRGEDMYENNGYIVHFFDAAKVEHLASGFEILGIDEFEEGSLPRKLFRVTLRKDHR